MLLPVRRKNPSLKLSSPSSHLPRSVARHQTQSINLSRLQKQLLQQNPSLNLPFCPIFPKFLKSQSIAQVVRLLTKPHPLRSQLAGRSRLLSLMSLLFLKLLHPSLVVEAAGAVEEAEVVAAVVGVDEDEVVVVDAVLQH
jgi:hypothetical protein